MHPSSVLFTRKPRTGWVIFHEMEETKKAQYVDDKHILLSIRSSALRIRILTEIEPDW